MEIKALKQIITFIKNKYLIAIVAFIVWMCFFDSKDWGLIHARANKLKELKQSEQHLAHLIIDTKKELVLLKSDAESIETYAREHFYMKKDNEELFIVK